MNRLLSVAVALAAMLTGCHADGLHHVWFPKTTIREARAEAERTVEHATATTPTTIEIVIEPAEPNGPPPNPRDVEFYDSDAPLLADAGGKPAKIKVGGEEIDIPDLPGRRIRIRVSTGGETPYERTWREIAKGSTPAVETKGDIDATRVTAPATTLPAYTRGVLRPGESTFVSGSGESTARAGAVPAVTGRSAILGSLSVGVPAWVWVLAVGLVLGGVALFYFGLRSLAVLCWAAAAVLVGFVLAIGWLAAHAWIIWVALALGGAGVGLYFIVRDYRAKQDKAALTAVATVVDSQPDAIRKALKDQIADEAGKLELAVRAAINRIKAAEGLGRERPAATPAATEGERQPQ
jgi:hypothetical protein